MTQPAFLCSGETRHDETCVRRIKDTTDYSTFCKVISDCRAAAQELGCSLIEVEQFWLRSATPVHTFTS
jgi:hypothetical protein